MLGSATKALDLALARLKSLDVGDLNKPLVHLFDEAVEIMRSECADLREQIVQLDTEIEEAKAATNSQVTWMHGQVINLWESQHETLMKIWVSKQVDQDDAQEESVTTETIDLGRKTLSRVREVGSVLYLNKQNASCKVLSELEQIRDCELRTS